VAHQHKSDGIKKHLTESSLLGQKNISDLDIQQPAIPDENVAYADDETNNDDNSGTQKPRLFYHTTTVFASSLNSGATIQCSVRYQVRYILKLNQPIYILLHQLLIHFTV
jgi:hypothetical protein